MRIVICGGPGSGKSEFALELSARYGLPVLHTDDLTTLEWSEQSVVAARWLNREGSWIIEGVTMVRALRKWLARGSGLPFDTIYWMERCYETPTPLRTGTRTIWDEIQPELIRRNANIRVMY